MSSRIFAARMPVLATLMLMLISLEPASAQSSTFTYQGRLTDGGPAANGNYDLQFALFDSLSGGTQIGSTQTINTVAVSNGVFTVSLDFGATSFNGANRFLEISARLSGAGSFTLLTPRQQVTATPYAIRSVNASSADALSGSCSGCVADANISGMAGSKVTGTIPASAVPAGSGNYIQNTTSQQTGTNFNIAGNGTAGGILSGNVLEAVSQFRIGGNRILSNAGTNNLFAGVGSGQANTSGTNNSFFGFHAGQTNASGSDNTFFGFNAGLNNFGVSSLGVGISNSFFGSGAGQSNSNGRLNTFVGAGADFTTTVNANGERNTLLGASTRSNPILVNATAIGSQAMVTQSNSLVLGSINGVNGATADTNVGIGTTSPTFKLQVVDPANTGLRVQTNTGGGTVASFGGNGDFQIDAVNVPGGRFVVKENGFVGIGHAASEQLLGQLDVFTNGESITAVRGRNVGGYGVIGISDNFIGAGLRRAGVLGVGARTGVEAQVADLTTNLIEGYIGDFVGDPNRVRKFHITGQGTYVAGSDFAEALPGRGGKEAYEPGDVLVVSTQSRGAVEKSRKPNDTLVAGVYSTRPGMLGADKNGTSRVDADDLPVAIIGIVPTKVSTENGPIHIGDLLTTSSTPGYAMKALPLRIGKARVYRTGTILGKALEPLKEGKGVIKVLVTLR